MTIDDIAPFSPSKGCKNGTVRRVSSSRTGRDECLKRRPKSTKVGESGLDVVEPRLCEFTNPLDAPSLAARELEEFLDVDERETEHERPTDELQAVKGLGSVAAMPPHPRP